MLSEREADRKRERVGGAAFLRATTMGHTHTDEQKKELPTGETVKHLLPLPHTAEAAREEGAGGREGGWRGQLCWIYGAAFESCPVAVNINSR